MLPLLYHELVGWYRLLDPIAEHADETSRYIAALEQAAGPECSTLLELGSGAGHNAWFLKRRFQCTLTDVSQQMLDASQRLNPDCEHVRGDMRDLRLSRVFDAVLVHDAINYVTSPVDLESVVHTVYRHLRPGGAAIFAPDAVRETFREHTLLIENDENARSLRCVEWKWDPDRADDTCVIDFAFLLRDGAELRAIHDRHVLGLFPRATWLSTLERSGFQVQSLSRPVDHAGYAEEVFVACLPPS